MLTLLRLPQVVARFGRKRSTIYTDIKNGLLPKPVAIGAQSVGFPEHEIEAILAARISGKGQGEIRELVSRILEQRKGFA